MQRRKQLQWPRKATFLSFFPGYFFPFFGDRYMANGPCMQIGGPLRGVLALNPPSPPPLFLGAKRGGGNKRMDNTTLILWTVISLLPPPSVCFSERYRLSRKEWPVRVVAPTATGLLHCACFCPLMSPSYFFDPYCE